MSNNHTNQYRILSVEDFLAEVNRGRITNLTAIRKFGAGLAATAGFSGVWDGDGTAYPFVASGSADYVHFSGTVAADDNNAGIGARKIHIFGVNENWEYKDEVVELSGTALQYSINKYARIFRAYTIEVGSFGVNSGTINMQLSGTSTILATVKAGNSQTLMAWFPVAAGYKAEIITAGASLISDNNAQIKTCEFEIRTRTHSIVGGLEVFHGARIRDYIGLKDSAISENFTFSIIVPERTDIYILAKANAASTKTTANPADVLTKVD
jgi:hypothetical protein